MGFYLRTYTVCMQKQSAKRGLKSSIFLLRQRFDLKGLNVKMVTFKQTWTSGPKSAQNNGKC